MRAFLTDFKGQAPVSRTYVIWIGANDLFDVLEALQIDPSGATSIGIIQQAIAATAESMQTLCAAGVREFLVVHLAEGGIEPAAHVAWISGSLYDLACWLEWAQISHNAIGPGTLFVSPGHHTLALLGGWWYAAPAGERLSPLTARTVDTAPHDIVRGKVADLRCDLELIRATGLELLGDAGGGRLLREPSVPRPLADWLRHPSSGSALTGYGLWRDALVASFGARRFSRLDVTPEQIYPTVR